MVSVRTEWNGIVGHPVGVRRAGKLVGAELSEKKPHLVSNVV